MRTFVVLSLCLLVVGSTVIDCKGTIERIEVTGQRHGGRHYPPVMFWPGGDTINYNHNGGGGGGGGRSSSGPSESPSNKALTPGASGEDVVDEITKLVEKILGETKGLLKKIALVESQFGKDAGTYRTEYDGGIFQVDRVGFEDTQNLASHPGLAAKFTKIQSAFGIDWRKVSWSDLKKPLYSAIASRLYLSNVPSAIPPSLSGQAQYWKTNYNSVMGAGTAAEFIRRWNDYLNSKNSGRGAGSNSGSSGRGSGRGRHGGRNGQHIP